MKFGIDRSVLAKALRRCALPGAYAASNITGQLWLGAREKTEEPDATDRLILRAINGLVGIEHIVQCKTLKPGATCVNAKRFTVGVNAMNSETVGVRIDGARLAVEATGTRRWSDPTITTEFPPMAEPAGATWMKIRRDHVLTIIEKLLPNVPNMSDDQRALKGIYVEVFPDGGNVVTCALGAHLITVQGIRDANAETRPGVHWAALLPEAMLPLVRDAAEDSASGEHLEFYYTEQYLWCTSENTMIQSARHSVAYPDYVQMMRILSPERVVELPRGAILDSMKNLISVRTERVQGVKVLISAKPPTISFYYEGDGTEFRDSITLPEAPVTGMSFKISPEVFRQAVDSAGENPIICTTSEDKSIVLRTESGYTSALSLMHSDPE